MKIVTMIVCLVIAIGLLYWLYQRMESPAVSMTPTVTVSISATPSGIPSSTSGNITLSAPAANSTIGNPVTISGRARVFENALVIRVRDQDGRILAEKSVMANAPDVGQFGPYSISLTYLKPSGTRGTVEAFDYSAKDGAEIDKVTIPVNFK
jgi:hypothetical protein